MSTTRRSPKALLTAATVTLALLPTAAAAGAAEVHNFIAPPLGTFNNLSGIGIDQSNGNVYAFDATEVKILASAGGPPAGPGPTHFDGSESFNSDGSRPGKFGTSLESTGGVTVDDACGERERLTGTELSPAECMAYDPSNGAVYVQNVPQRMVDKYRLNSSGAYEFQCAYEGYQENNKRSCYKNPEFVTQNEQQDLSGLTRNDSGDLIFGLEGSGVAVDAAGNLYAGGRIGFESFEQAIFEFNAKGEAVREFPLPEEDEGVGFLAVSSDGSIFVQTYNTPAGSSRIVELKRSSLTGPEEGQQVLVPGTEHASGGVAFDRATGQLLVSFQSSAEAIGGAHEVVSRFGAGVIEKGGAIAVNEATGEIYVANGFEHNIDRFGPGVQGAQPTVDSPPPTLTDITRTSALLNATIDTGDATTHWQLQYVPASEYEPTVANPYAAGGSSALTLLEPSALQTSVGPIALTGLSAGATYHYRIVASNELGAVYGPDHTFTTAPATPPVVETGAALGVSQTGATLTGSVDARELNTSYEFEVGTDTGYGGAKLFGNAGSGGSEAISVALQYLIPGTTYHYRLVASNQDGTSYGQDMTFTTPPVPTLISQPPTAALLPVQTFTFPTILTSKPAKRATKHKASRRHKRKRNKNKRKHSTRSSPQAKRSKSF